MARLNTHNPEISFLLGDFGWNQWDGISRCKWGDYRYNSLKGTLDLLNNPNLDYPAEVIPIIGNHDVARATEDGDKKYRLLPGLREGICLGEQRYWGNSGEPLNVHFSESSGYNNFSVKKDFDIFTPLITDKNICKDKSNDFSFQFSQGGIQFIILGHDFTTEFDNSSKQNWLTDRACRSGKENSNDKTSIVFLHDGTYKNRVVELLSSCDHNVKGIFAGHTHIFENYEREGIKLVNMYGIFEDEADYINVEVYGDYLVFNRYLRDEKDGNFNKSELFRIPGEFSNYISPYENDYEGNIGDIIRVKISINEGFNFIGRPFDNEITAKDFINELGIENGFSSLVIYRNNSFSTYTKEDFDRGELGFNLKKGEGVILKATRQKESEISGHPVQIKSFSDSLGKGWNLISYHSDNDKASDLIEAYKSKELEVIGVASYNRNNFDIFIMTGSSTYGKDYDISSGKSYWIRIK